MTSKAIISLVAALLMRGLWADAVQARSEPFEFYASSERLAEDVSDGFVYRASGETIVSSKSNDAANYVAVGEIFVFATSPSFSFQAVGEAPVRTQAVAMTPGKAVIRLSVNSLLARGLTLDTTLDVGNLRFRYWEKLTDEPTYLAPTVVEVEQDGTIRLEVEMPPANSGFLQPVLVQ